MAEHAGRAHRARLLLRFQQQATRMAGMPLLALTYPSPSLAQLCDPLELVAEIGASAVLLTIDAVVSLAERRIEKQLGSLLDGVRVQDGPVDESWYWAAPLLLDARTDADG